MPMFKNSFGKKPHTDSPLGFMVQVFSLLMRPDARRCDIEGCLWSHLGNVEFLKKGYNFVTCLLSFLPPLVWSQHNPKMSGGGVW